MAIQRYTELAVNRPEDLLFGHSPRPLSCGHGLTIGAGEVYPEINFTLPPMEVTEATLPAVREQYTAIVEAVCRRAVELHAPGLVVEFELLPPMTIHPDWGESIVVILRSALDRFHADHGLRSALRVTPTDIRDIQRPIHQRSGPCWQAMRDSFRRCASAGADLLSIESTGGKEVCDGALVQCDLQAVLFGLGVLGVRDMAFLWDAIGQACEGTRCKPAGDTACGFANTAMVLADRHMIPRVFASVVRTVSAVRSLVAYERGAVGPSKDCAYEGPFLKAITGLPISMEGKSAACAHLSPVGNIAAAAADLWSNESVQNVKLLSATAPVVSIEQLIYDCRLMNVALAEGPEAARRLRDWLVRSDAALDPQAFVLTPENVVALSRAMVTPKDACERSWDVAAATLSLLRTAAERGELSLSDRELHWLDMLDMQLETAPRDEPSAVAAFNASAYPNLILSEYGL